MDGPETMMQGDGAEISYPGLWDAETLRMNLAACLKEVAEEVEIPMKRLLRLMERDARYRETMESWEALNEAERLKAWKRLVIVGQEVLQGASAECAQCGECCSKASPTLHLEDLEILRSGGIPLSRLVCLRRGEPVRSPFEDELFHLDEERIKIREKPGTTECVFLDGATGLCTIYPDRPAQCEAQACWDPSEARELSKLPHLTRRDLFNEVDLLLDVMAMHDEKCSFENLQQAFRRLEETGGESVDEVLKLLAYEDHFRTFMAEQLKIPGDTIELVFGRSYADLTYLFGFHVVHGPDGGHCLVPDQD
ncbi:MAG: YkgJ family cysteine cluster protein [Acidobacteriota bacterium]